MTFLISAASGYNPRRAIKTVKARLASERVPRVRQGGRAVGKDPVCRQSEGRSRQDDHRRELGRRLGQVRQPYAPGRPGPAVQCDQRPESCSLWNVTPWSGSAACTIRLPHGGIQSSTAARQPQFPRRRIAVPRQPANRPDPGPPLGGQYQRLRLRVDRLSAFAGRIDASGVGGVHRGADAHPVRVLRHGGAHADDPRHPQGDGAASLDVWNSAASC